jgi:hypothetical protein
MSLKKFSWLSFFAQQIHPFKAFSFFHHVPPNVKVHSHSLQKQVFPESFSEKNHVWKKRKSTFRLERAFFQSFSVEHISRFFSFLSDPRTLNVILSVAAFPFFSGLAFK